MSDHILKSHNKSLLLYHIVCPAKYRRKIFTVEAEKTLKEVCVRIEACYEIHFIEIGADENHVHFLIQSVPMLSVTSIVRILKSITARELFRHKPEIKKMLWGGHLWTSGYYVNTVGQYSNERIIREYVKNQGKHYKQIYRGQLTLFDGLT